MPKRFRVVAGLLAALACDAVPTFAQSTPPAVGFKVPMTLVIARAAFNDASTLYFIKQAEEGGPTLSFTRDKHDPTSSVAVLGDTLTARTVQYFMGHHPRIVRTFLYSAASINLSCGVRRVVTVNVLPLLPHALR